jgi:hypothetical protein
MRIALFQIILSVCVLLCAGCANYYKSPDFNQKVREHEVIAVLPFEMIFTGRQPGNLSAEDLRQIRIAESQAFQISLYHEILRSTRRGKKAIYVDIQDYKKTTALLRENDISIEDSWEKNPVELANVLGVDAVVRARVSKERLMSDLSSYGIDVATQILEDLALAEVQPFIPPNAGIAKRIDAGYNLVNAKDGSVLWSTMLEADVDWRWPSNEIIDNLNRRASNRFPYR